VKEFSQAMVELKKGQVTEKPVKTQFGFHIIRLDDTRETPVPKFDEVKARIAQQMQQGKLAEYQQGLREKAKIE
jgi:peptidyl-prolyl cis-trans isomerase C